MNITLTKAIPDDKATIQNLGRFYVYDMYRYCGFLPGWKVPSNGLFECNDLSSYSDKRDRHAFLVKVDEELAGFVLINKVGSTPDVDWNMGEFFIISKFQGKGVGSYAAKHIFNQFPGIWETAQIPVNKAAIEFWEKTINRYTHGKFEKSLKTVPHPKPHPMLILKFSTHGSPIRFKILRKDQEEMLKEWLRQDYVAEFWHGEGLQNTLKSISRFVNGKETLFTLWIAYDGQIPFGYLMTSKIDYEKDPLFAKHLSPSSKAITLDLLIGNPSYLGKGFGHQMIKELLKQKFNDITDVFIDPGLDNPKAIHVYEKAGFRKLEEFIPEWDPSSPNLLMHLKMEK